MTGPSLDLDALREKAERATADPLYIAAVSSDVILAVLALVDEQRKENERLRKYARHLPGCRMERIIGPSECSCGLNEALAGSPAENKQQ